jgi:hypothetical protein
VLLVFKRLNSQHRLCATVALGADIQMAPVFDQDHHQRRWEDSKKEEEETEEELLFCGSYDGFLWRVSLLPSTASSEVPSGEEATTSFSVKKCAQNFFCYF